MCTESWEEMHTVGSLKPLPAHHWKDLKHWFSCHIFPFCMQTSGDNVLTMGCGNFRPSAQLMGAAMRSREACVQALTPDSKAVTCFLYVQRNQEQRGCQLKNWHSYPSLVSRVQEFSFMRITGLLFFGVSRCLWWLEQEWEFRSGMSIAVSCQATKVYGERQA